jgi:hypothetical protein
MEPACRRGGEGVCHECIIGMLRITEDRELVTVPELKEHIEDRERRNQYTRDLGVESGWLYCKEWTLRDYADKRKSTNLTRFDYCPECGKKIDWKAIRKEGKE